MKELDTEKTIQEIYDNAMSDKERALNCYESLRAKVDASEELPRPGVLTALNESQKLIQTSTDKLIKLVEILTKRDSNKKLEEMNFGSLGDVLKDDDQETQEDRIKNLEVVKNDSNRA